MTIGNSHETTAFIVDNLRWWWHEHGMHQYPSANFILLLCDSGGANGHRHHAFKKQLLDLSEEIQLKIVVCHYPPYCSKWNPLEHRFFSQTHPAIDGQLFVNYQQVKELFGVASYTPLHDPEGLEMALLKQMEQLDFRPAKLLIDSPGLLDEWKPFCQLMGVDLQLSKQAAQNLAAVNAYLIQVMH